MTATLIQETDLIDVSCLCLLVYGPPGGWKTSIAQTAYNPITLDFDKGIHRSFNRKTAFRFERWADLGEISAEVSRRQTVVVDTIGRALDVLTADIIAGNAKFGSAAGGLSLQGFGALKARFAHWIAQLRTAGKDIVFLAHEKEEKDGDDRYMRPDIQGGSYTEVMKYADLVGYLSIGRQGQRTLDFNPTDRHLGKNAAGWESIAVPSLKESPRFLADLLTDAKRSIGKTAELSAQLALVLDQWQGWLDSDPNLAGFNGKLPEVGSLHNGTKKQVWALLQRHAQKCEWLWDAKSKTFYRPNSEPAAALAEQPAQEEAF